MYGLVEQHTLMHRTAFQFSYSTSVQLIQLQLVFGHWPRKVHSADRIYSLPKRFFQFVHSLHRFLHAGAGAGSVIVESSR